MSQNNLKRPLRPCLSPTRLSRSSSPVPSDSLFPCSVRSSSASSVSSSCSSYTVGYNGQWMKRTKTVRWEGETDGSAVTSYHSTWSATDYDRSPLAPPSEEERACVLPERGSRCLTEGSEGPVFTDEEVVEEPECVVVEETHHCPLTSTIASFFNRSPSRQMTDRSKSEHIPRCGGSEDSDDVSLGEQDAEECGEEEGDQTEDEWDVCERRRMMFARMSSMTRDRDGAHPQFEGYRSLSATLAELLRQVNRSDDNVDEEEEHVALVHTREEIEDSEVDEDEVDDDIDLSDEDDEDDDDSERCVDDTPRGRSRLSIDGDAILSTSDENRLAAIHQLSDTLFISEGSITLPSCTQDLFVRLRGMSGDSTTSSDLMTDIGTPSLVSCSSSEADASSSGSCASSSTSSSHNNSVTASPIRPSHLRSELSFTDMVGTPNDDDNDNGVVVTIVTTQMLTPAQTVDSLLVKSTPLQAEVTVLDPENRNDTNLHPAPSLF